MPKKTAAEDSPEVAALKARALDCDKAKWIANAEAKLAKQKAALQPYSPSILCPKCGDRIQKAHYHRANKPFCTDPYEEPGRYYSLLYWGGNSSGQTEHLGWWCKCGHVVDTKTKDASDA